MDRVFCGNCGAVTVGGVRRDLWIESVAGTYNICCTLNFQTGQAVVIDTADTLVRAWAAAAELSRKSDG